MRLARIVSEGVEGEVEVVHLYDENIGPCRGCGGCASGTCVLKDGMERIMRRVAQTRCLVLASPLHFTSLSGPMVGFIGRLEPWWRNGWAGGNPGDVRFGVLVVTGGSTYGNMFEPARAVAAAAFRVLGVEFSGMATAAGTDAVGVEENGAALDEARELGRLLSAKI